MKEAATNPQDWRSSRRRSVGVRIPPGLSRFTLPLAALLGGTAMMLAPAYAQESPAAIDDRIEGVFDVVPGNVLDLAVPLSRRALARRIGEKEAVLLPYAATGEAETRPGQAPAGSAREDIAALPRATPDRSAPDEEEGSAEAEGGSHEDVARVPRPRPVANGTVTASLEEDGAADASVEAAPPARKSGDLVAAAATKVVSEEEPGSEDGQRLPRPRPVVAAADEPAAPESVSEVALIEEDAPPAAAKLEEPAPAPVADPVELPPEGTVARADCIRLAKVAEKDGDFKRNAEVLSKPGFCIAQEKFKERRRQWTVQTVSSGRQGPLWAVMHDDEDLAFDSAVKALNTYGGTLITLETGGKRNQDGIDPNRNFSDDEISCNKLGKSATPRFTAAFKKLIDPSQPIIAIHNNHDGPVPTGGLGHVSMTTVPKDMRKSPSDDPDGPLAGDRAVVLLAATEPLGAAVENRMDAFSASGVNVVVEPVRDGQGDCSLSNYAVLSGHKHYANVTVDHDESEKQMKIIDLVVSSSPTLAASR